MTINPATVGALCHYTATSSNDPFFSSVYALLHFDQANNNTTPINTVQPLGRGSTWSCGANIAVSDSTGGGVPTVPPKFGVGYLWAQNTNGGCTSTSASYVVGTGAFTAEWWWNAATMFDTYAVDIGNAAVTLRWDPKHTGGTNAAPYVEVAGSPFLVHPGTSSSMTTQTWHFISISRTGGTMYYHEDGTLIASAASAHNFAGSQLSIGKSIAGGFPTQGTFDDFRFTVGVGRYTGSNYAVPTAAFPNS